MRGVGEVAVRETSWTESSMARRIAVVIIRRSPTGTLKAPWLSTAFSFIVVLSLIPRAVRRYVGVEVFRSVPINCRELVLWLCRMFDRLPSILHGGMRVGRGI